LHCIVPQKAQQTKKLQILLHTQDLLSIGALQNTCIKMHTRHDTSKERGFPQFDEHRYLMLTQFHWPVISGQLMLGASTFHAMHTQ